MSRRKRQRICVLNGGGDCPGLNAVIRSLTKTAILRYQWEVWGSEDSFDGLIDKDRMVPLTLDAVRGILPRGGTILGTTNRGNPFHYPEKTASGAITFHDYSKRVIEQVRRMEFQALVIIGGDGTLSIACRFLESGLPVIGIPKTIDKDLAATEATFGFDTALQTATEAIDKIHTTAESHDRVMVVEVMGRNAGWIAVEAGLSGGADVILIPEIPFRIRKVCQKIEQRARLGRPFSVVVVAEGAAPAGGSQVFQQRDGENPFARLGGIGFQVADEIREKAQVETRVVVLGHLQRGGTPTPFDRLLGTRFGVAAVELAERKAFGQMVSLRCGAIESVPLREAVAHPRLVDPDGELVAAGRALGVSFGD